MGREIHDLTAAYALDALDPKEEAAFEEHLAECAACRAEVASLQETAASLATAVSGPPPPEAIRARILDQVGGSGATVIPLRRRRPFQALLVAATAALALAAGLGAWAAGLRSDLADERLASAELAQAAELLSEPGTHHPVQGADGILAVARNGDAGLVLRDLPPAPEGHVYEAWVVVGGDVKPAGLFDAGSDRTVARLSTRVPKDAVVGVTVEPEGGSASPTGEMVFTART